MQRLPASDFCGWPRVSPDGRFLVWLAWDHPNMPWEISELRVAARQQDGIFGPADLIASLALQHGYDSNFQPEWSPEGTLYYVCDHSDWWNLYRGYRRPPDSLCPREAEFGRPQWLFGNPTYAFAGPGRIVCSFCERGLWQLALLDTNSGRLERIDAPYTDIWSVRATPDYAVFCASSATEPAAVVRLDLATRKLEVLRRSSTLEIDNRHISVPRAVEFPTEGGQTAHAFFASFGAEVESIQVEQVIQPMLDY
ncbi:MAG TPA: hypothetical protein VEL76_02150, partial [Gemmataceae bacterium]|nr:hypothetical protein [Gemmataceae bacterium]